MKKKLILKTSLALILLIAVLLPIVFKEWFVPSTGKIDTISSGTARLLIIGLFLEVKYVPQIIGGFMTVLLFVSVLLILGTIINIGFSGLRPGWIIFFTLPLCGLLLSMRLINLQSHQKQTIL